MHELEKERTPEGIARAGRVARLARACGNKHALGLRRNERPLGPQRHGNEGGTLVEDALGGGLGVARTAQQQGFVFVNLHQVSLMQRRCHLLDGLAFAWPQAGSVVRVITDERTCLAGNAYRMQRRRTCRLIGKGKRPHMEHMAVAYGLLGHLSRGESRVGTRLAGK